MVSQLVLLSRYRFVTNSRQLADLVKLIEAGHGSLDGLLVILDSSMVTASRHASRINTLIGYLTTQDRKLGLNILVVKNPDVSLDKRLGLQIDHTSKVTSKEIKQKEVRL